MFLGKALYLCQCLSPLAGQSMATSKLLGDNVAKCCDGLVCHLGGYPRCEKLSSSPLKTKRTKNAMFSVSSVSCATKGNITGFYTDDEPIQGGVELSLVSSYHRKKNTAAKLVTVANLRAGARQFYVFVAGGRVLTILSRISLRLFLDLRYCPTSFPGLFPLKLERGALGTKGVRTREKPWERGWLFFLPKMRRPK